MQKAGKTHAYRLGAIACSTSWDLMLRLHYRAYSGRVFLYDLGEALPSVQTQLFPPAKQGTVTPVLRL